MWPRFLYGSLFEQAFTRGLTTQDQALFDGPSNFERVLGDLEVVLVIWSGACRGLSAHLVYESASGAYDDVDYRVKTVHHAPLTSVFGSGAAVRGL